MLKHTITILECSRIFSSPMTIFSWLVVFIYGMAGNGNVLYGIIAFIGLFFVHLATNLIDDFFDYKFLIKQVGFDKKEYLKNSQKTKCRYLVNGQLKESQLLRTVCIYLFIAIICGGYLYFKCGVGVLYFALVGAVIALTYPLLSRICLSELAVAIAYGPALFGGVYYVMFGTYSFEAFIFSIPTMFMTVILLYIHTVMDYEFDTNEGKKTLSNMFDSQLDSLVILKVLMILAYISPILLCVFDILDWQVFIVYLTIPMAIDLYDSMVEFSCNPDSVPAKKWYHFPMENLEAFAQKGEDSFMIRMFQARNLMGYFSVLFIISIILGLGI